MDAMKRIGRMLKHYFIPHEGNDHKPHLLRPRMVAFVALIAVVIESVFLFGTTYLIPRSRLFSIVVVSTLVDGTNRARLAANIPALRENALLDAAAQAKANDMVANHYFAHVSPSGISPWFWIDEAGYSYAAAGENLAVDFLDSADVTNAWLNSPTHRENIMNANFTEIGMATAQGDFDGHPAIYVVEMFGSPSVLPALAGGSAAAPAPASAPAAKPVAVKPAATEPVAVKPAAPSEPLAAMTSSVTTSVTTTVKGAETVMPKPVAPSAAPQANLIQSLVADPRRTVDYVYLALASLFGLALFLNIFIKIRIQHPQLILGGMLVILVAGLFIVLNQHAAHATPVIF